MDSDSAQELEWADAGEAALVRELTRQQQQMAEQLITIPVLLAYGRADVLVPPSHGEWLAANVPTAAVLVREDGGHLPANPEAEIAGNMAWLRFGAVPAC